MSHRRTFLLASLAGVSSSVFAENCLDISGRLPGTCVDAGVPEWPPEPPVPPLPPPTPVYIENELGTFVHTYTPYLYGIMTELGIDENLPWKRFYIGSNKRRILERHMSPHPRIRMQENTPRRGNLSVQYEDWNRRCEVLVRAFSTAGPPSHWYKGNSLDKNNPLSNPTPIATFQENGFYDSRHAAILLKQTHHGIWILDQDWDCLNGEIAIRFLRFLNTESKRENAYSYSTISTRV